MSGYLTPLEILKYGDKGAYGIISSLEHNNSAEKLADYEKQLKGRLLKSSASHWEIAILLAELVRSGAWTSFYRNSLDLARNWRNEHSSDREFYKDNPYILTGNSYYSTSSFSFFIFLKEKFGLCRTTVYNYLQVVETFATFVPEVDIKGNEKFIHKNIVKGEYKVNGEAECYQFWQLVEMLPLSYQERFEVKPNWTREEIRAYKKSLSQKAKPEEIQPAEQAEAKKPPKTEAQQRYEKYSKNDLINEIVKVESERDKLAKRVKELEDELLKVSVKSSKGGSLASKQGKYMQERLSV